MLAVSKINWWDTKFKAKFYTYEEACAYLCGSSRSRAPDLWRRRAQI